MQTGYIAHGKIDKGTSSRNYEQTDRDADRQQDAWVAIHFSFLFHLSIHLSIYPSIHLSIYLCIYPSVHLSLYL